jgi:hypothetical protein
MSDHDTFLKDDYSDLASFDGDYKAENTFRPDLDTLPDGDYDFEILDADLTRATGKQAGVRILTLVLRPNGGATVRHTYWLRDQEQMNRLGADLVVLGFDADKWGKAGGKSIAQALPEAVARLKSVRFRGRKATREGTGNHAGKKFHDLHVGARIGGSAMPAPAKPFNEFGNGLPGQQQPAPAPAGAELPW